MIKSQTKYNGSSFGTFLWRVTSLHMITYFLFGILAFSIFSYDKLYTSGILQNIMKPTDSSWVAAGPALQLIRGILFAIILWPFKEIILFAKYGWLKLWLLFVGLSILGTAGPSPGSFEGVIYTKLSYHEHIIGLPEILLQTLLLSWLLFLWYKKPSRLFNIISIILVILILLMSIGGSYMRYGAHSQRIGLEQPEYKEQISRNVRSTFNPGPKLRVELIASTSVNLMGPRYRG
jgi:hypothetical protein